MVLYLVRDLLFVSKIREAAEPLGVPLRSVRDAEALREVGPGGALVIVDLGLADAMTALEILAARPETAGVPVVGFVGHERTDVMETARALGCGRVMAKGEFAAKLPALLREVATRATEFPGKGTT